MGAALFWCQGAQQQLWFLLLPCIWTQTSNDSCQYLAATWAVFALLCWRGATHPAAGATPYACNVAQPAWASWAARMDAMLPDLRDQLQCMREGGLLLLCQCAVHAVDRSHDAALYIGAKNDHIEVVRVRLAAGANKEVTMAVSARAMQEPRVGLVWRHTPRPAACASGMW